MTMRERFAACAGLDTAAIAERFEDDELDDVCREVLAVFAERTDASVLPSDPFAIRLTMYGDADVSDFVVRYSGGEASVGPPVQGEPVHAHGRWEHWEDAIRLFNDDIPTSALVFANRITDATTGDNKTESSALRRWLGAVDFAGTGSTTTPERLMTRLTDLMRHDPGNVQAFVDEVGLQTLVSARAYGLGHTLVEAGARDDVRGFYIRCDVDSTPPASAKTVWSDAGIPSVVETDPAVPDDPERGATMRFSSATNFLELASRTRVLAQQLASGSATLEGTSESINQFWKVMMHLLHVVQH